MAISKKMTAAAVACASSLFLATSLFSAESNPAPKQDVVKAEKVLRVGSLTVYAPFEYRDSKTGEYVGFDMDLIREVGRRTGYKIEIVSMSLDGLVPALMAGNIDAAVSALTITPERSEKVDFTKPYINAGLTVMTTKQNAPEINSIDDLRNKKLCAEIGSSGALFMKRIPGAEVVSYNSAAEAFLELNQGGCYAMLNDSPVNKYFLKTNASQSMNLVERPFVASDDFYGIAVQKGDAKLLKMLDDTLDEMKKDGSFDAIYAKWFGSEGSSSERI